MATCRDTIKSAYRRCGAIAAGVNIGSVQASVGLEHLRGMYETFLGGGLLGRLTNYRMESIPYEAKEFERIFNEDEGVVTFPVTVRDDHTGKYRQPLDGAVVQVVNPMLVTETRIYDAALGSWQLIEDLTLDGVAPLTNRWESGIKAVLAVILADEIGLPITRLMATQAGACRLSIASRYDNERRETEATYF